MKIVRITADKTEILIDMNQQDVHVYLYVKELLRQIAEIYPETRRRILMVDPRTTLVMDKKIFDYWLKGRLDSFIFWANQILSETYPGGFYTENPKEDTILHIQRIILPKDDEVIYSEIIFYGTVFKFPKNQIVNKPYLLDRDIVASIRVTPINNNDLHVKCLCEIDHDQVIDWLTNLKIEIENSPFHIITKGTNNVDDKSGALAEISTTTQNENQRAKGPSVDTQQNFLIFKEFKEKNPSLTQSEVAEAVNAELGTNYSSRHVSHAYKACGYKWEAGNK